MPAAKARKTKTKTKTYRGKLAVLVYSGFFGARTSCCATARSTRRSWRALWTISALTRLQLQATRCTRRRPTSWARAEGAVLAFCRDLAPEVSFFYAGKRFGLFWLFRRRSAWRDFVCSKIHRSRLRRKSQNKPRSARKAHARGLIWPFSELGRELARRRRPEGARAAPGTTRRNWGSGGATTFVREGAHLADLDIGQIWPPRRP